MSDLTGTNNVQSVMDQYSIESKKKDKAESSDKDMFLKLMLAQMKNQNPLDPQEGSEFLAQLAQFSTVEGINKINDSMSDFSSSFRSGQALQATTMIGRRVQVESSSGLLTENTPLQGSIDIPQSVANLQLEIFDSAGQKVKSISYGPTVAGNKDFDWDGINTNGEFNGQGRYSVKAFAEVEGEATQLSTFMSSNVDSVSVATDGSITLNVESVGAVSLANVKKVQ